MFEALILITCVATAFAGLCVVAKVFAQDILDWIETL